MDGRKERRRQGGHIATCAEKSNKYEFRPLFHSFTGNISVGHPDRVFASKTRAGGPFMGGLRRRGEDMQDGHVLPVLEYWYT